MFHRLRNLVPAAAGRLPIVSLLLPLRDAASTLEANHGSDRCRQYALGCLTVHAIGLHHDSADFFWPGRLPSMASWPGWPTVQDVQIPHDG